MDVISYLVIVLAIIGHFLITRASLGFGYTLGLRRNWWHVLVAAHALAGLLVPVLMLRYVGLGGPGVMRGGSWASVAPAWQAYIVTCIVAVPVCLVMIEWRRRHAIPALQLSNHTATHDVAAAIGQTPAPMSLAGRLARLPRNEMFHVDLTERRIVLPRLPRELEGFSILHLTDLHFCGTPDRRFFDFAIERCAAQRPDLVVITGDILDRITLIDWLQATLGKVVASAPLGGYFVLGNHDIDCDGSAIRSAMQDIGWTWIGGRCVTIEHRGRTIALAGNEVPWAGARPACDDAARAAALRIMLSHAPHEVRWARRNGFDLALAGHLHGGQIRLPLLGPIIGGRLAGGLFHLPPTVLHVSRGLGALTPLRFGCRPEVVKLVLHSAEGTRSPADSARKVLSRPQASPGRA